MEVNYSYNNRNYGLMIKLFDSSICFKQEDGNGQKLMTYIQPYLKVKVAVSDKDTLATTRTVLEHAFQTLKNKKIDSQSATYGENQKSYKFLITSNDKDDLIEALEKIGVSSERAYRSLAGLQENLHGKR